MPSGGVWEESVTNLELRTQGEKTVETWKPKPF